VGGELAFWAALFVLCCTVHIMARHGMEIRGIRYRTAALPLPPPRGSVRTTAERWVAQNLLPKRPHAEKTKMERIQIRPNLTTPLPAFALEPSVAVCSSQLFLVDNGMDVCARVQVVPAAVCSVVWRRPVMTPTSARLRKDSKLKALRRQTSPSHRQQPRPSPCRRPSALRPGDIPRPPLLVCPRASPPAVHGEIMYPRRSPPVPPSTLTRPSRPSRRPF
jgi:hypothetical protein